MIALPWNTVRIELSNVSGSVSLSRKPDAPALMAAITYSSRSNVVKMITRFALRLRRNDVAMN